MGKQYAFCDGNVVKYIEKRTEAYDEPYPIKYFVNGAMLVHYKEIPEAQNNLVQPLWIWDETENLFREPKLYEEVNGEIYLGSLGKEAISKIGQDNARLLNENTEINTQLTDTQLAVCDLYESSQGGEA